MVAIPMISLENLNLSKYVCGTNQFVGISHNLDFFYSPYYHIKFRKPNRIIEILTYLAGQGINAVISSPRERIFNALESVEQETGIKIHWICSPSKRKTIKGLEPDIFKQIDWCADHGVSVCMPHRSYTDVALNPEKLTIEGLSPILEHIRDKKMIPGLSCHSHKVIQAVEKQNYDVKIIVQPLNQLGFESDIDPVSLIRIIQNTNISILNIKPLAAGRLDPHLALPYCLKSIKKNDLIAIGTPKLSYAKEIMSIFNNYYGT